MPQKVRIIQWVDILVSIPLLVHWWGFPIIGKAKGIFNVHVWTAFRVSFTLRGDSVECKLVDYSLH